MNSESLMSWPLRRVHTLFTNLKDLLESLGSDLVSCQTVSHYPHIERLISVQTLKNWFNRPACGSFGFFSCECTLFALWKWNLWCFGHLKHALKYCFNIDLFGKTRNTLAIQNKGAHLNPFMAAVHTSELNGILVSFRVVVIWAR